MDFALNTYMSHAGIRLREARSSIAAEKAPLPAPDKWLPFFPKTKKVTEPPYRVFSWLSTEAGWESPLAGI